MKSAWIGTARYASMVLLGSALLAAPGAAGAQPVDVPPTWGGDFWDRPRLTGSWWGLRDELGKKGVVFDADLLLTPQGVLSGGRDTGWEFWGNADYTLNIDTGKLGLWPGGFFKFYADSGFGDNVFRKSGAIVPPNAMALLPKPNDPTTALMNATFMQFLSPKFGLFAGKIFTLDSFKGEFAGDFRNQFMNTGLAFPMALVLVPFSAYGGGVIALPWEGVVLSAMAIDPSGTTTNNDISEAFDDGAAVVASGQVTIKPFGLVGHQTVGGFWSNKSRLSLTQDPSNVGRFLLEERFPRLADPGPLLRRILERFFPQLLVPVQPANREDTTWTVFYGFDQYFWHPGGSEARDRDVLQLRRLGWRCEPDQVQLQHGDRGQGDRAGASARHLRSRLGADAVQRQLLALPARTLELGLDHEDAVEMFYNASLTRWLNMSLDLQVIDPALKKTLGLSGLKDMDTAVVGGVRMYIRF